MLHAARRMRAHASAPELATPSYISKISVSGKMVPKTLLVYLLMSGEAQQGVSQGAPGCVDDASGVIARLRIHNPTCASVLAILGAPYHYPTIDDCGVDLTTAGNNLHGQPKLPGLAVPPGTKLDMLCPVTCTGCMSANCTLSDSCNDNNAAIQQIYHHSHTCEEFSPDQCNLEAANIKDLHGASVRPSYTTAGTLVSDLCPVHCQVPMCTLCTGEGGMAPEPPPIDVVPPTNSCFEHLKLHDLTASCENNQLRDACGVCGGQSIAEQCVELDLVEDAVFINEIYTDDEGDAYDTCRATEFSPLLRFLCDSHIRVCRSWVHRACKWR
jgi:hypothetical protein